MANPTIAEIQTQLGDTNNTEARITNSRLVVVESGVTEYNELYVEGRQAKAGATRWVRTDATDTAANQASDILSQLDNG